MLSIESGRRLTPGGLRPRLIGLVLLVTLVTEFVFAAAVTAHEPSALTGDVAWISALTVLVGAALGGLVAIQITRPLLRLRTAAMVMAKGDLDHRVNLTQKDEIGDLGRAFDHMATVLAQHTADLEAANSGLARQARQLTELGEGGALLQLCSEASRAYEITREYALRLFPTASGSLYVMNPSGDALDLANSWGDTIPEVANPSEAFMPDQCGALLQGETQWWGTTDCAVWCAHLLEDPSRVHLCAPLMARGEQLGVLSLSFDAQEITSEPDAHSKWIAQLAIALAGQLALVLRNLALQQELRSEAIHDPLTGLFNRRYLDATLEREVLRAVRNEARLSVVMLDLDRFKHVNDTLGHEIGDVVLRQLGQMLQAVTRGGDVAARYGGEEFVLVLPNSTWHDACARAEELREAIKHLPVQRQLEAIGGITISAGVAGFPEAGTSEAMLLRAADAALYRAKAEGRDRVVAMRHHDDPILGAMSLAWSAE